MEDRNQLLTQDSASKSINLRDNIGLGKRRQRDQACHSFLRFIDLISNGFFFTALTVFFWAATWDLIIFYIFPTDLVISYTVTFLIANSVLICAYVFQDELQQFHDGWLCSGHSSLRIYDRVQHIESQVTTTAACCSYYDKAFLFRFIYSYLIANAYVAQWRTYWDIFDMLVQDVNFWYFFVIALIAVLMYRVVLNNSLDSHSKTVPFSLVRDNNPQSYFIQWKKIDIENKRLEHFLNFLYYEIVEMMISVFIWKGFWDLFETGLENLLKSHPNAKFLSICITGLIGYALYFILLSYEYLINKCKFNCMNVSNQKDFVYLFSLVAVVAVWRFLWDGYDYFVLESNYQVYVMIGTHFGTLILLFLFQVGTILYGPGGLSTGRFVGTEECSAEEYLQVNTRIRFYDIEYFASPDS